MLGVFGDALILGWRAAKSEKSLLMTTNQNITAKNLRGGLNPDGDPFAVPFCRFLASERLTGLLIWLVKIVRLPSRGMLGMDEFAKMMALRGEVAANGVRRAVQKGVDPLDKEALAATSKLKWRWRLTLMPEIEERYAFDPGVFSG